MIRLFTLFICIGCLWKPTYGAVVKSVPYVNYTVINGLPSSETYDVFQDTKGYIWAGTDKGVVRYNGEDFEVFTTMDGLTDNTVFIVQEDSAGRIWFGTYSRRLCYFENGQFHPYPYNDKLVQFLQTESLPKVITQLGFDNKGNLELVLKGGKKVSVDKDGVIKSDYISRELPFDSTRKSQLIQVIAAYSQGAIQVDVQDVKHVFNINHAHVLNFYQHDSLLLIGSTEGLTFLDMSGNDPPRTILTDFEITGMCYDFEGGLWCSTLYNGLLYVSNPNISFFEVSSTKDKGHFLTITRQDSLLFFCFEYQDYKFHINGLEKVKGEEYAIDLEAIPSFEIEQGVKFENPMPTKLIPSTVLSVLKWNDSTWIYSATEGSLNIISTKENKGDTIVHSGFKVMRIFKDSEGDLWLGALDGLYKMNTHFTTLEQVEHRNLPSDCRVQDICELENGFLVIATRGNGLFLWDGNSGLQLTEQNGLLSNTLNQVLYDFEHKCIWVASNKGINKINFKENKISDISVVLDAQDGFVSTDIRQLYSANDTLYFGGNRGIGMVAISDLRNKNRLPKMSALSLTINDQKVSSKDFFELAYFENNMVITYQGISYQSYTDLNYEYRLSEIDSHWKQTSNKSISYNSLAPGNYVFQVRAINAAGIRSEVVALNFIITPAFWMTLWFKIMVVVVAFVLFILAIYGIIQRYQKKLELHKKLNELSKMTLQAKMNPHFIFNSLNSIQNYILKNEKEKASDYLLEFSRLIRVVLQNSDSPYIDLSQELETLRLYITLEKRRLRSEFEYIEIVDETLNTKNCKIPSLLIQPFIENAIWHGKVHKNPMGKITLQISLEGDYLKFEITDNGIGRKRAEALKRQSGKHISYATTITKKRIALLENIEDKLSEIEISDASNIAEGDNFFGTKVCFKIPYRSTVKQSLNEKKIYGYY